MIRNVALTGIALMEYVDSLVSYWYICIQRASAPLFCLVHISGCVTIFRQVTAFLCSFFLTNV